MNKKQDEEGRAASHRKMEKKLCKEIPVGRQDAAAIPVQETSVWLRWLDGWRAVWRWLKAQNSLPEQGNRNKPQTSSLLVYREHPSDRSRSYPCEHSHSFDVENI